MKTLLVLLFLPAVISAAAAQTQQQMNADAQKAYAKADKELNDVYQQVTRAYKADTIFIASLRNAEKAWIQFRDAQLEMKYPYHASDPGYYGSIYPLCAAQYLAALTRERTKTLRQWLTGVAEGDVCSGSVRTK